MLFKHAGDPVVAARGIAAGANELAEFLNERWAKVLDDRAVMAAQVERTALPEIPVRVLPILSAPQAVIAFAQEYAAAALRQAALGIRTPTTVARRLVDVEPGHDARVAGVVAWRELDGEIDPDVVVAAIYRAMIRAQR